MRVQYFRYSIKLMSPSSHLEHRSFLRAYHKMIYNEFWTVKNAYTSIKLFYILGSFSVWGFMRRDYFSRCMHNHILKPPGTHVFVTDGRCTGFHLAPLSSIIYLRPFSYKDQRISQMLLMLFRQWESEKEDFGQKLWLLSLDIFVGCYIQFGPYFNSAKQAH